MIKSFLGFFLLFSFSSLALDTEIYNNIDPSKVYMDLYDKTGFNNGIFLTFENEDGETVTKKIEITHGIDIIEEYHVAQYKAILSLAQRAEEKVQLKITKNNGKIVFTILLND